MKPSAGTDGTIRPVTALHLFEQSLDHPADERVRFVTEHSAGDEMLRGAALALLDAHARSEHFLEPPEAPHPRLGAYQLLRVIGAGGMGRVWLAEREDGAYRQEVAIKVLPGLIGDPDAVRRAHAERQFLAWADHPNIARVLDGGTTPEGQPYVVMEYVDGMRIDDWCRERQLDPTGRVRLFLQVLDAIDAAHRALIIHRDIKPGNVLVTRAGAAKLLDFGIAKSLDGHGAGNATRTCNAPMTPDYASPEQLAGKPLTTATDIYSLGLLLYELLSGTAANARSGLTPGELAQRIKQNAAPRPSLHIEAGSMRIDQRTATAWQRRIAGDLDRVVTKALAPEPQRRYESAHAFADDLQRWLAHRPVTARSAGIGYRFALFVRRNAIPVTASAAAAGALAVGLGLAATQAHRAAIEGERAMRANQFMTEMIASADPYQGGKPPLLVDALDRAVQTISQRLAGQPLLEADIRHAIGRAYLMLERNDAARTQLDRAAQLRADTGGTDYARILDAQGVLEWQTGHYENAERRFREGLAQCADDVRGRQQRAELLNDLAALLGNAGRYDEARAAAEQALGLYYGLPETKPRERGIGYANLAVALEGLDRRNEALESYQQALRILETAVPPATLDMSITLNNLANLQSGMSQRDLAIASLERSIALRRNVMGPDFPRLTVPLANLARRYSEAGRHDDGARTIDEALRLAPRAFSANDQMLGHLHATVATIALARGDNRTAREQARLALDVYDHADAVEPGRREIARSLLERSSGHVESGASTVQ